MEKTNHSPNTIENIRAAKKEAEQKQIEEEDVLVKSPIDIVRGIINDINSLIHTKQLNDKEEKKWERWVEQLRELLKVEVDGRIAKERADAL